MRKLAVFVVAAVAVAVGGAPAHAAPGAKIQIKPQASKIYQFDVSPEGDGSALQPATNVTATFLRCPAGEYQMTADLKQDGQQMYWTASGLGAGERFCDGTTKKTVLTWGFTGETLHAGKATAKFALYRVVCDAGVCETEDTPTVTKTKVVTIPRG